jgi:BirA family biotin operon repressor/biotin-[acetyl-CoA-carboxylase] ligase
MNQLTAGSICEFLKDETRSCLDALEVFGEIGSTNSYLLGETCPAPGRCRVALTENQTNGRGRRDRVWLSPRSSGLCLSMAFTFRAMPEEFPSLSLAIGIGIAQALERLGIHGIGLKWPNDIIARDGKLGGVLSEVHPARGSGTTVVAGVGINVDFNSSKQGREIATSIGGASDLASCCDELPSRPELAAGIIESLIDIMVRFDATGFSPFYEAWQRYDWLRGRAVTIETAEVTSAGIAEGVDTDGALLLNAGGDMRRVTSGSVILSGQSGALP